MSDAVIAVENLSKRYVIDHVVRHDTLRDGLAYALDGWWRRLRRAPVGGGTAEEFWALRDVSFTVARGDVLGIIGRNGAGKSTLLKIVSRITEPSGGCVRLRGRVASLLEVGTGFHPELTGRENIYLNGALLGMSRGEIRKKFDEIVGFAEVDPFIDTPVKRYSSGMYVRLAFAVAAHLEPEILLVDEVLAVGDAEFQKRCLGKMSEVAAAHGRTVLFVSHNMAAVSTLCSKGILLDRGRVVALGHVGEVIQRYIHMEREVSGAREWDDAARAPGNEVVRFKAVRIVSDGEVTADVRIDRDVWIELVFVNYKPNARIAAGIQLVDHLRSPVLASANMASVSLNPDPWAGRAYPVGVFQTRCRIPANFLNEGRYGVNALVMTDHQTVQVQVDEAVAFTVHETGEMRREFTGRWIGVVRPRLEWHTEHQSEAVAAWD